MSSNVGLTTPRGSGTSGYVQRNLSHLKPRDAPYPSFSPSSSSSSSSSSDPHQPPHRARKPNADILAHDRLREIEVLVYDLRDKLEDEGVLEEEEIEARTEGLRKELMQGDNKKEASSSTAGKKRGQLKQHDVHKAAVLKEAESERLRRALGIREGYEEGDYWVRKEKERGVRGEGEGGGVKLGKEEEREEVDGRKGEGRRRG